MIYFFNKWTFPSRRGTAASLFLGKFFWWKVLVKSTCRKLLYTMVLQFSIHVTIATNTTWQVYITNNSYWCSGTEKMQFKHPYSQPCFKKNLVGLWPLLFVCIACISYVKLTSASAIASTSCAWHKKKYARKIILTQEKT